MRTLTIFSLFLFLTFSTSISDATTSIPSSTFRLMEPGQYFVVAQDGSGEFTRIMDAINAAPDYSPTRFTIKIKAGVYDEILTIGKEKWNLTFLTGNRSKIGEFSTFESATLAIEGDRFLAQDITFQNTAGPEARQAVAVRSSSDYSIFYRCRIIGFQDTLYTQLGIQFFRDCEIYGTVDFIFGHAKVVLQNCYIYGRQPQEGQSITITAQNRDPINISAIVIHNCIITASTELRNSKFPVKVYLGRPWSNYSSTVVMQSFLDTFIDPIGWLDWENRSSLDTIRYIEYANRGPGANTRGRVNWKGFEVLNSSTQAAQFTIQQFIDGDSWIPSTGIPYDLDLTIYDIDLTSKGVHVMPRDLLLLAIFHVMFIKNVIDYGT